MHLPWNASAIHEPQNLSLLPPKGRGRCRLPIGSIAIRRDRNSTSAQPRRRICRSCPERPTIRRPSANAKMVAHLVLGRQPGLDRRHHALGRTHRVARSPQCCLGCCLVPLRASLRMANPWVQASSTLASLSTVGNWNGIRDLSDAAIREHETDMLRLVVRERCGCADAARSAREQATSPVRSPSFIARFWLRIRQDRKMRQTVANLGALDYHATAPPCNPASGATQRSPAEG
jgi:hypothetical protein